jgi:hypothetical protein
MLRHDQLEIRLSEIDATLQMVKRLVAGELSAPGKAQNLLKASRTYDWSVWRDLVDVDKGNVTYAGHSFGGTAMVSGLSFPCSQQLAVTSDDRFDPAAIVIMDPAVQREFHAGIHLTARNRAVAGRRQMPNALHQLGRV